MLKHHTCYCCSLAERQLSHSLTPSTCVTLRWWSPNSCLQSVSVLLRRDSVWYLQRFRAEDHARRKAREELEDAMNSRDLAIREAALDQRMQQALREEDHLRTLRDASNAVLSNTHAWTEVVTLIECLCDRQPCRMARRQRPLSDTHCCYRQQCDPLVPLQRCRHATRSSHVRITSQIHPADRTHSVVCQPILH